MEGGIAAAGGVATDKCKLHYGIWHSSEQMNGDAALPKIKPTIELWLELETRCNLRCPFCYNFWKDGSQAEPKRAKFDETIGALCCLLDSVDCSQIALSGGEPLLLPFLDELLAALMPYHIPVVLTTNGVLLSPAKATKLIGQGIYNFQIPLHSHIEEVHNDLSGEIRCWEQSIAAIAAARECGGNVAVVFVATRRNVAHLPFVLELCSALDVHSLIFNRFIPSGLGSINAVELGSPSEPEIWEALGAADAVAVPAGIKIQLGVPVRSPSNQTAWRSIEWASCPVRFGQRRWTIGADLNIRRCNHSAAAIGNLLGDGIEKLVAEVRGSLPTSCDTTSHYCQFLEPDVPFDVDVRQPH